MESSTRISVAIRMRPILKEEVDQGQTNSKVFIDSAEKAIVVSSIDQKQQKKFLFDSVFDEITPQNELFNSTQIPELLKKVVQGFNATIFAYGQTGSGKTYTMEGYDYNDLKPNIKVKPNQENEKQGVVPRAIKALFEEIKSMPSTTEYTVYCTYLQVYQEKIYDLLNPAQLKPGSPGLKMRWSKHDEFYVENLYVNACYNATEVLTHFHAGLKNKIMASHNLNSASSRSHCILSLNIEGVDVEGGGIISSKLQLVDLAGSERASLTGNEGLALKESIEINKSLFTLRQVITTLAGSREGESAFVPYRDSKLTSLLKQSIGGNSFCLMIACLCPCDQFYEENLSTLAYATKASCIANIPVKNLDPKSKLVNELRKEIKGLQNELKEAFEQIGMLTELVNLDKTQTLKMRGLEKPLLATAQGQRAKTTKIIEQIPGRIHSAMAVPRPVVPQQEPFSLSLEMLSENLHDSVKMIKELMGSNKKLKEIINELSSIKKGQDIEIAQLHAENQTLLEKLENVENEPVIVAKLQKEKQELQNRVVALERENKQAPVIFPIKEKKTEWAWKSKRTIVRAGNRYIDSPGQIIDKDHYQKYHSVRPSTRVRVEKSAESTRQHKSELSPDNKVKEDALSALSVLYSKTRVKKYGTFF
ncbi:hypothetical protein SteCoe_9931 [Stentor coeruleus]|uniref:Kinesin-like protein n=1 Tax=Stentor coeruleus TaxID=5963 RepID=A0A1R2CGR2_9CILI|nr:hypothetical protein SteCoe_9931 [Stentor coeruleus]